jgi:predicted dehydrogenase
VKQLGDIQEPALRAGERPDRPGWGEEPAERWGILSDGVTRRPVKSEHGAYQRFYEGMVRCLRDGAPPPVDPEDAVKGLEIIEAARQSAAERRVVTLA